MMGRPRSQPEGQRFGRLRVLSFSHVDVRHNAVFKCQCDCGKFANITTASLRKGTKSCGCLIVEGLVARNLNHGHAVGGKCTREYSTWRAMMDRCTNSNASAYSRYGGRGIRVCKRWTTFANFFADMGQKPKGKSIDRINNDGHYTPSNCRWATPAQQSRNSSQAKLDGEKVREIKRRLADGEQQWKIGAAFHVDRGTIGKIARGERWADVS